MFPLLLSGQNFHLQQKLIEKNLSEIACCNLPKVFHVLFPSVFSTIAFLVSLIIVTENTIVHQANSRKQIALHKDCVFVCKRNEEPFIVPV